MASPAGTVTEEDMSKLCGEIKKLIDKHKIEKIVLGFPKNMNATLGDRAKKTLVFKEALEAATNIEVVLWDERLSSALAHQFFNESDIKGKKRKNNVDTLSAAIILQNFIDYERNSGV